MAGSAHVMRLEGGRQMRGDIGGAYTLVEPQQQDNRGIRAAATPVPGRLQQLRRRRRKGERVRLREPPAADGGRGGVDRDREARGERQRLLRIRREDQDRRAGPSERAANGGRDSEERRPDRIRNPSQRHHRFREDDADLVGFCQVRDFIRRSRADDGQLSVSVCGRTVRGKRTLPPCDETHDDTRQCETTVSCH